MRFSIIFESSSRKIFLNYQRIILSILKNSFNSNKVDIYSNNNIKPFTFSVYFPESKFILENGERKIQLSEKKEFILNFSTWDINIGLLLYNGIIKNITKGFQYKDLSFRIKSIVLRREILIKENKILFKTLSPIVIREHINKTNQKDIYLTFQNSDIETIQKRLNDNMRLIFKKFLGKEYSINIELLNNTSLKTVPVKITGEDSKRGYIPANVGKFFLRGDKKALEFVYKAGLGARRSFGFGMLEVVNE